MSGAQGSQRRSGSFPYRGGCGIIKRFFTRNTWVLLLLFLMCRHPVLAAEGPGGYPGTARTAREILWKGVTSGGVNSGSVAVLDKGRIVFSEGYGPADRAEGRLIDGKTRFNIGSTSKMFAAVSVLLLVDEGKIGLDDPVVKYLQEFEMKDPRHKDITVRMLFNHSSGLPGSTFDFGYRPEGDFHEILLKTMKDSVLKHDPGAMGIYCNDGFTLAEMIVERVSDQKYIDFLAERIFRPLEMNHTGESVGLNGGPVAEFYDPDGKKYPHEVVGALGAGGLSSTAEDLCRFADSFMPSGRQILSPSALAEILKVQPTPFAASLKGQALLEAFGWDYQNLPDFLKLGFRVYGKSGGTLFYTTNLQLLPSEGMAVAVIYSGAGKAEEATYEIMKALMVDRGLPVPREKSVAKLVKPEPMAQDVARSLDFFANTTGFYRVHADKKKGSLKVYPASPAGAETVLSLVYNDGFFHDPSSGWRYYVAVSDEGTFLFLSEAERYGADIPVFQQIETMKNPREMSVEMDGTLWLVRNASPFTIFTDSLLVRSSVPQNLSGYVNFSGPKRVIDPDFVAMAATGFRDQSSLKLFRRDGKVRAKVMEFEYSGEDAADLLKEGTTLVAIGPEGENEWLGAVSEAILSFRYTDGSRIIVFQGPGVPPIFDSIVDTGEVYVPEGSFIFLAGSPGDLIYIAAR